jgi:hypothetical protein
VDFIQVSRGFQRNAHASRVAQSGTTSVLHVSRSTGLYFHKAVLKTGVFMNVTLSLGPLVALIAGILILVMPRLLNFIVALYLIIIGLIGIFGVGTTHF